MMHEPVEDPTEGERITVIEQLTITLGVDEEGDEVVFSEVLSENISYITASGMLHAAQRQLDDAQREQSD